MPKTGDHTSRREIISVMAGLPAAALASVQASSSHAHGALQGGPPSGTGSDGNFSTPSSPVDRFSTRNEMASSRSVCTALLIEPGREGVFVWEGRNLVAALGTTLDKLDPREGIFIPPLSDRTGRSGSWVRKDAGHFNVRWFGAKGDDLSDDTMAIQAAADTLAALRGGLLFFPAGTYCYRRLNLRPAVMWEGAGPQSTHLRCTDNTTTDPGMPFGSSIRRADDGAFITRLGFRNISILTALSGVAPMEMIFRDIIALNLAGCERTHIDNVNIAGFGYGAIVLARADAGTEGLGFTRTKQDGNHNTVVNLSLGSCGRFNPAEAAIWLKYSANSNNFSAIYMKPCIVGISIDFGDNNNVFGGSVESAKNVAVLGRGRAASGNLISGVRAESISGDAYLFLPRSYNNTVISGYHTGVRGQNYNLADAPNNRVIAEDMNNLRTMPFPPESNYAMTHNHGALRVSSINGSAHAPLYIKSEDLGIKGSFPYMEFYNDMTSGEAGDVLGGIGFRTNDNNSGASGVSASVKAILESSTGDTALAFFSGRGQSSTEKARITSAGRLGVNTRAPEYSLDINGPMGFKPGRSVTPLATGYIVIEATDATTLTFKLRGDDGIVRTAKIKLS